MAEPEIQQPPTVVLDHKKVAEMQAIGPKILAQAQDLTVDTKEDYEASGMLLNTLATRQQRIIDFFEEPAKQANAVHKFITGLRATLVLPLQQAEQLLKNRRRDWRNEEERKRVLKEEEERKKAKEEADARAIEEAKQLAEIGETAAAEIVIERAATAPAPPVIIPSTVPKQAGHNIRKVWKFRVKNPSEHKREFLILDDSKVQTIVSKLGRDAETLVGGIEVFQDEIETTRRK